MSQITFTQLQDEEQRLYILRALVEMGFDGNAMMLITALEAYGQRVSYRTMLQHLEWLESIDLVELSKIGETTKARLTQDGQDVADGRITLHGVRKPRAGEYDR